MVLRVMLGVFYIAVTLTYLVYEWNAHRVLQRADELEITGRYRTAATAYDLVLGKYPFSVAIVRAREGLHRVAPAAMPRAEPRDEPLAMLDPLRTEPFPTLALAISSAMFLLVAATRIRHRLRLAAIAAILCAGSASTGLALATRDGFLAVSWLEPVSRQFRESPLLPYIAAWSALSTACLFTLSRRRSRPHPQPEPVVPPTSALAEFETEKAHAPRSFPTDSRSPSEPLDSALRANEARSTNEPDDSIAPRQESVAGAVLSAGHSAVEEQSSTGSSSSAPASPIAAPPAPLPSAVLEAKLRAIRRLHNEGLLSDAEYRDKQAVIVAQL